VLVLLFDQLLPLVFFQREDSITAEPLAFVVLIVLFDQLLPLVFSPREDVIFLRLSIVRKELHQKKEFRPVVV